MSDRDVQREIEENERRVRPEHDVGIDQDVLQDSDDMAGGIDLLVDPFTDDDEDDDERMLGEDDTG